MSRAALLFVTATVATSCGGSTATEPGGDGGGRDAASDASGGDYDGPVALYGPGPIFDAGPGHDAGPGPTDAEPGFDAPAVMYGPATIDSGSEG